VRAWFITLPATMVLGGVAAWLLGFVA